MSERLTRDKPVPLNAVLGLRPRRRKRWVGLAGLGVALAGYAALPGQQGSQEAVRLLSGGAEPAHAAPVPYHADCSADPAPLQRELTRIAQQFNGKVGIAVTKAGCDWVVGERAEQFFPQQSVSKLWVSLAVLDAADRGRLSTEQQITIRPEDLTLFNQPLRGEVLEKGAVTKPVVALMKSALSLSDNTANDRLLWTVGGPDVVRATLKAKQLAGIRFGPGERLLQSEVAGLTWIPEYAIGRNFEQARARLPMDQREAALSRYMVDPMDGATPHGIARALAQLAAGQLLSPASTGLFMDILSRTHSGPRRLKAGAPAGWKVYHKTGTGQELRGLATGYNDVAILEAPDGSFYGVAVMVGETREPISVRTAMMQSVSAAVGRFYASITG